MGLITENDNELSISDMVKNDQEMRSGEFFDLNVDFTNQKELKKMMGETPNEFLNNLDSLDDIQGIWLIAQHADNDLEFQRQVLDLLKSNIDFISKKFNIPTISIQSRIAMLIDRIMVNETTSVEGYRNSGKDDFSDVGKGKQKYGTQGGELNGNWVPRPIEIDNNIYFFQTPEKLLKDEQFLKKINYLRNSVGLPDIEEYLKQMNS